MKLSSVLNCIFSFTVLCFTIFSPPAVYAGNTFIDLEQSILPVRFIYLDSEQNIIKIWNNVGPFDRAYVIKFYTNTSEIEIDQDLIERYTNLLSQIDPFKYGYISTNENNTSLLRQHEINLLIINDGYEEIHTYI